MLIEVLHEGQATGIGPEGFSPEEARAGFQIGEHAVYRALARQELRDRFGLTERESQVAHHLAVGMSNAEIAVRLRISVHTVRRHVEHVLMRLGVRRRSQVASRLLTAR